MALTTLKNDRFLRALAREPVDVTPVWLMRQAGRYLPEYRATRTRAGSFLTLCSTPDLACEVTIQPLLRYPLDAAILFSDILTIPHAMGLGLQFLEGEGPVFERPVRDAAAVANLGIPDPEDDLGYVTDAIRLIRQELAGRVPLIGFAGSPWTVATYMVEGGKSADFAHILGMMNDTPAAMHALLDTVAQATIEYLNAQVNAGAQALMLFDTWGGVLEFDQYRDFSLNYMARIVDGLTREAEGRTVPIVLFTKGGGAWLEAMAECGCDALGIDAATNLGDARSRVGQKVALQGNLEPTRLLESPAVIERDVAKILADFGHGNGHVFNLGHGVQPQMDPEHIGVCIDAVHKHSAPYHA